MSVEVVVNRNADRLIKGEKHTVSLDDAYWDSQLKAGNITVIKSVAEVAAPVVEEEPKQRGGDEPRSDAPPLSPSKKSKKKGRG